MAQIEAIPLTSLLPAPRSQLMITEHPAADAPLYPNKQKIQEANKRIPPYGQRQGWVPRTPEDFGDGGAFPEIHVAQYPLEMGKKETNSFGTAGTNNAIVPITYDSEGKVRYEAIVEYGRTPGQKVFAKPSDAKEKLFTDDELQRPDEETIHEATEKTRKALEEKLQLKIKTAGPASAAAVQTERTTKYIRYTPANENPAFNSGAKNRIIRMVELPKDPLEPPKFKNKKVPRGPPSPPVPVMHSPPRKVTAEDREAWKIPPCISNWKNNKGYTIPLDKRLAADGRGLIEPQINDAFAKLSQALYLAERKAREEVAKRAALEKKLGLQEKEKREEELRRTAQQARLERAALEREKIKAGETEEERKAREERERIKEERRREREREHRLEQSRAKKAKSIRDAERDITEKIALGQAIPRDTQSLYDQRLFNQTQGIDSGFGDDESYNIYDKTLFGSGREAALYKAPSKADAEQYGENDLQKIISTDRFRPDKDFSGVDRSKPAEPRQGPVEFERAQEEEDVFGINELLHEAKTAKDKKPTELRQKLGFMHAVAGGSGKEEDYRGDPRRSHIQFESKGRLTSELEEYVILVLRSCNCLLAFSLLTEATFLRSLEVSRATLTKIKMQTKNVRKKQPKTVRKTKKETEIKTAIVTKIETETKIVIEDGRRTEIKTAIETKTVTETGKKTETETETGKKTETETETRRRSVIEVENVK